jgi:hypothetical protein
MCTPRRAQHSGSASFSKESIMTKSISNEQVTTHPSKVVRIIQSAVRIALALIFVATGTSKILGVEQLVDGFTEIGLGQWFRYFTGAIEISGALLVLWPLTSGLGRLFSSVSRSALFSCSSSLCTETSYTPWCLRMSADG